MARQQLSDLDFLGTTRIINLPDGTDPQHPATVAQLRAQIEGLGWKDSVRAATTGNIDLASPGASIDGVAMVANDRVLVKNQTTPAENGIYVWNGSATPMTRSADASTFDELESAIVTVEEGTAANVGTSWRQTSVNGTLGTTAVNWTAFGTAVPAATETVSGIAEIATQAEVDAGVDDQRFITPLKLKTTPLIIKRYEANFGDGTATQYTITHNLNSRDLTADVYRNSGAYDRVELDIEFTTANTITVRTAAPVASNALRIVVKR